MAGDEDPTTGDATGDEPTGVARLLGHAGWLIGIVALIAWFAMLWFMFGDVL